jgi:hypothetical protein
LKKFWILFLWIGVCQSIFFTLQSFSGGGACFAQTNVEKKKIDFLLHEIEQLKGAKFWRNGTSYSPHDAAEYLRMKMTWNYRSKPVTSAKDFIERIASKSTITGKPYLIQMEDNKKMESKTFLEQRLSVWKE